MAVQPARLSVTRAAVGVPCGCGLTIPQVVQVARTSEAMAGGHMNNTGLGACPLERASNDRGRPTRAARDEGHQALPCSDRKNARHPLTRLSSGGRRGSDHLYLPEIMMTFT